MKRWVHRHRYVLVTAIVCAIVVSSTAVIVWGVATTSGQVRRGRQGSRPESCSG